MGADFSAYAVIGLKIDIDKLYTEKKVKAFNHKHPESMKFDPETGRALWKIEQEEIEGFSGDDFLGYKIVSGTDGLPNILACISTGDETYSNGGDDAQMISLNDFNIAEEKP